MISPVTLGLITFVLTFIARIIIDYLYRDVFRKTKGDIITPGEMPSDIKKFECEICGCVFTTSKKYYRANSIHRHGLVVRCMHCNHEIYAFYDEDEEVWK